MDQTKLDSATESLQSELTVVADRPFIKNPLLFFSNTREFRLLLTVTDNDSWMRDIELGEKMFGTVLVSSPDSSIGDKVQQVKDVLKQRLRYPNIQENADLLRLAKVWILPNKIVAGPSTSDLLHSFKDSLATYHQSLGFEKISFLKVELSDGKERMFIYKMLDDGYRPSLVCVKWSHDLDDNYSTAYCAGHLVNSGYVMVHKNGDYVLYWYCQPPLYDTVSYKEITYGNPIHQGYAEQLIEGFKTLTTRNSNESCAGVAAAGVADGVPTADTANAGVATADTAAAGTATADQATSPTTE